MRRPPTSPNPRAATLSRIRARASEEPYSRRPGRADRRLRRGARPRRSRRRSRSRRTTRTTCSTPPSTGYDNKQYRELYGTAEGVKAAREGKPIPAGRSSRSCSTKAQVDAAGNPVKDANGPVRQGRHRRHHGHGKAPRAGGRSIRRPSATASGNIPRSGRTRSSTTGELQGLLQCHKLHAKQDFVISLARLEGKRPAAPSR